MNIFHYIEISKRKANWIGHILRRNCLLQGVNEWKIKGGIELTGRRGRRRKELLADLTERRGYSHLKEEARDRTMWRAGFGTGFGPVVRQTAKWMNDNFHHPDINKNSLYISYCHYFCYFYITVPCCKCYTYIRIISSSSHTKLQCTVCARCHSVW